MPVTVGLIVVGLVVIVLLRWRYKSESRLMGWKSWSALSTAVVIGITISGLMRQWHQRENYNARAAHGNEQFLAAYNMRRSGDVITIVGTSSSPTGQDRARGEFALISLKDMDKTVALSGASVRLCDNDDVAASGTYEYGPEGGVLIISDTRNVAWQFSGYFSRLDALIWAIYPAWCGLPGMPINPR